MEFIKRVSHTALSASKEDLEELSKQMINGLEIKDRKYYFTTYPKCFLGTDAVKWLLDNKVVIDSNSAIVIGNLLINEGLFKHVTGDHMFKNEELFYRFSIHEENRGKVGLTRDGAQASWKAFLAPQWEQNDDHDFDLLPTASISKTVTRSPGESVAYAKQILEITPLDEYNATLLNNVHPQKWIDPEITGRYNLVVLGAGAGGLVSSAAGAGVGAKVALIEENLLGGDCLNVGCVPSKALIKSAKMANQARHMKGYGIEIEGKIGVNFPNVMKRMRKLRAGISVNDSATRFASTLGVDVFLGRGKFTSRNSIAVNGKTLTFSKAIIATGGSASVPPIKGIKTVPYLTNATFFNLTSLPARFGVIGAGPIGCELAQSMCRFGSKTYMFLRSDNILGKEEKEAANIVLESMKKDGVEFYFKIKYESVELESKGNANAIRLNLIQGQRKFSIVVDQLLLATGRRPNVKDIGLDNAAVNFDIRDGVIVNDILQTTNKNIYAVGDCCTKYQFTHMADFMARIAIRNSLFFGKSKVSSLIVPWATFTDPEIGHVGLYEADLRERKINFDAYMKEFSDNDRAICDGETEGYVRILCQKGTDRILGATIVCSHAGDMISEITLAMQTQTGLGKIATVIHPYPTHADCVRACGDLYNKTRLTLTVKKLFRNLMAAQR